METTDDLNVDDKRSISQVKWDALVVEINRIAELVAENIENGKNTNTNTLNSGNGATGIICAAVCAVCLIAIIFVAIGINVEFGRQNRNAIEDHATVLAELHDLHAWRDVHSNEIAALKAWRLQQEKK